MGEDTPSLGIMAVGHINGLVLQRDTCHVIQMTTVSEKSRLLSAASRNLQGSRLVFVPAEFEPAREEVQDGTAAPAGGEEGGTCGQVRAVGLTGSAGSCP